MKQIKSILLFILLIILYIPYVYAATCPLGKDVTQDLANILQIIQIAGPIIVVVVSIIEVAKTISKGNIQEESKKLGKRLFRRIIYCILLFFVPVLVKTGASIAQIDVSSCDLSNPSENNYSVVTNTKKTLTTESKTKELKKSSNYNSNADSSASISTPGSGDGTPNTGSGSTSNGSSTVVSTKSDNTSIKKFSAENGVSFQYYEIKPSNTKKNLPLIIFLHGSGEVGSISGLGSLPIVTYVDENKANIGEEFFFIAPNLSSGSWNAGGVPAALKGLIDNVVNEYDIDKDRMIITGMSLGAIGTWHMVATYGTFFSAAVPMSCCASNSTGSLYVGIPIHAMVGALESSYVSCMTTVVNNINSAGGSATLKAVSGASHTTIQQSYKDPELFKWMLSQ